MIDYDLCETPGIREYLHELAAAAGHEVEPCEMGWTFVNDPDTCTSWIRAAAIYAAAGYQQRMLAGTIDMLRDNIGDQNLHIDDVLSHAPLLAAAATSYQTMVRDRTAAYERLTTHSSRLARIHALTPDKIVWEKRPLIPAGSHGPVTVTAPADGGPHWPIVRADRQAMTVISEGHRHLRPKPSRPLIRRFGDHFALNTVDHNGATSYRILIEINAPEGTFWPLRALHWTDPEPGNATGPIGAPGGVDTGQAPDLPPGTDARTNPTPS
ncbi:hypothetical protein GCM10010124_25290 [Pilimelia terevasa]|uniref:Uncharacterized protein n=1 Tax=Pilimelia terevasa TaxID=53372 RepID=A0A8J3FIX8_9ACTN|nr:hypothetical protein [Pilimelia terevasa]GGK31457.1 hypothetical protein GCM10010124_25290 [Pilimelia terevasa]